MNNQTDQLIKYWATSPVFDPKTREEIQSLVQAQNSKELEERFYRDLEFGTGGLRGIIGAGTSRMNIYNVRKATYALGLYLKHFFAQSREIKVAISYDSRRFSKEFAQATAEVLAAMNIKALITKELRPVPMLSFMVRHFQCQAGVCVTASHNPPIYNGYKVYWSTGGQLVPPHDHEIIQRYGQIKAYEDIPLMPYATALQQGRIEEIGAALDDAYFQAVERLSVSKLGRDLKIVYSPLHGTGGYPVTMALKRFGFHDITVVPEQEKPDGNFPTVKSPNPEDPAAMAMAVALGKKIKADLVLATDPDSDRIGMVVREGEEFKFFNGNQIGSLLVEYCLSIRKEKGLLPPNPLVIKTVVTTDQQAKIAAHYGAACEETLTGFKWICQLIEDYETGVRKPYRQYVCGGEESYGFLLDKFVRDKDAVIACCVAAEMVAHYKAKGFTLTDVLDQLFLRHGVYQESLHTETLMGKDGAEAIKSMMHRMRTQAPHAICGIPVVKLRDLETCQEFTMKGGKLEKCGTIALPRSDVLQFILQDETKVSVRPSGTEPKIKFYISVHKQVTPQTDSRTLQQLKDQCLQQTKAIEQAFVAMTKDK